jgi:hypothetical protein
VRAPGSHFWVLRDAVVKEPHIRSAIPMG